MLKTLSEWGLFDDAHDEDDVPVQLSNSKDQEVVDKDINDDQDEDVEFIPPQELEVGSMLIVIIVVMMMIVTNKIKAMILESYLSASAIEKIFL